MNPERYALMKEYAFLIRNRYCVLRQASSPGWLPRVKNGKCWKETALVCIDNKFDPSDYVETLFRHSKPYPLVAHLHSERTVWVYLAIKADEKTLPSACLENGMGRPVTSAEWEAQTACEMYFINSRIGVYGVEEGLRIVMLDSCKLSPAGKALMARFTGYRLLRPEARRAYAILTSELSGPAYGRKFGLLLGSGVLEETIRNLETEYGFGSQ